MKTFTDKGAIKQAITDPLGPRMADESVSVTGALDQAASPPVSEQLTLLRSIDANLQLLTDQILKARL